VPPPQTAPMGWAKYLRRRSSDTPVTNTSTIFNTLRSHSSATADVETGPKLIKHRGGEPLREDVGELRYRRDMEDADLTDHNLLSDKMKISLHMLSALMLNGVGGEVHSADVVAVDKGAPRRRGLELVEQLSQPSGLSHVVGNDTILGLCKDRWTKRGGVNWAFFKI
jgi:hypothetical protein